jgi:hypothetical protein
MKPRIIGNEPDQEPGYGKNIDEDVNWNSSCPDH